MEDSLYEYKYLKYKAKYLQSLYGGEVAKANKNGKSESMKDKLNILKKKQQMQQMH